VVAHGVLLLVFLLLPREPAAWRSADSAGVEGARAFEIELAPEWLEEVRPAPPPERFVEINPAAPENPPDETPFFGAQNQQVAQPVPTPEGESDTPKVEGDGREESTAIVRGDGARTEVPSAAEQFAAAFQPPQAPAEAAAEERAERAERAINAPAGGESVLGEADGGFGSTVTRVPLTPGAESGEVAREGREGREAARSGGYFGSTPRIDAARPMARPRLSEATLRARNTPTIRNEFGTANIGALAYNAKWSSHGEYLQRLIDAVQAQWERLLMRSSVYPTAGATVRVAFRLNAQGEVSEILRVEGDGGEVARRLCVSAITAPAPYGEWTPDMVAMLGREQELTFTFFYQ
jgi:hypothetical protein